VYIKIFTPMWDLVEENKRKDYGFTQIARGWENREKRRMYDLAIYFSIFHFRMGNLLELPSWKINHLLAGKKLAFT
jgi:hypothetical protein